MTAAELLKRKPVPRRWVWDKFLPEGTLAVLSAYMRVGKTSLVYPLALAVARGHSFLGYPTLRGGVLILAVEEHRHDVVLRLRALGLQATDLVHVHLGRLENTPKVRNAMRAYITKHEIRLVLIDTLGQFWQVASENDNAQVRREVSPLLSLARGTGAAVLLVHHERKAGGQEGRGIRGAGALMALTDQALELERRPGAPTNQRVLRAWSRYEETPAALLIERVGTAYRTLGPLREQSHESAKKAVLGALSKTESRSIEKITQVTGLSSKETRSTLDRLADRVLRSGKGVKADPFRYLLKG
jgi:hypothetical protein